MNDPIPKLDEILVNPATGHRTVTSIPLSYKSLPINSSLPSCSHHHIQLLLQDRLNSDDHWLCEYLVPKISTAPAINSGFGYNGVHLTVSVIVSYRYFHVDERSLKLSRMVLQGSMKAEKLKSLKMETESCSIRLQSLVSSSKTVPTRMSFTCLP
ncbi:hypothetical protein ARALYDRAFT_892834 [Arabidopsis lyrata subsp. lyrata]|uniref:Uncharacterized protein n=1 Tax=Arabidopsis lyrata subsp. lyrata TaxID=81972 RepID=D7KB31_ARALL|nr:hypothetical protein ARALYDRAFT_892834 [Arabidopsis lyrata subsp. lyrata]